MSTIKSLVKNKQAKQQAASGATIPAGSVGVDVPNTQQISTYVVSNVKEIPSRQGKKSRIVKLSTKQEVQPQPPKVKSGGEGNNYFKIAMKP